MSEMETIEALRECQQVLAMLIDPETIQRTSLAHAWAAATKAETRARAALQKATPQEIR